MRYPWASCEGIAGATASITKIFSGVVSDVGRRKPLLLLGYGMAALTKPVFPLADTLGSVLLEFRAFNLTHILRA